MTLTATVVICTLRRPAFLEKCLQGVLALDPAADGILVVDNTPGHGETEAIARKFSVGYTVEPSAGLSYARNRGLEESGTDIVAFVDDDAVPNPDWLGVLMKPFEDPNVAAVTGKILIAGSQHTGNVQWTPLFVSNKDKHWFEIATFGGLGRGSNMALRKTACAGWTAFDVRLGRGAPFPIAEENYAFASLLSLGFTAAYLPSAIVIHAPRRKRNIDEEARNSFAYWLLLFSEFPERRSDLLQFLFRRLRREPLGWPRDSPDPGDIITSGWWMHIKAGFSALLLFLRTKRPGRKTSQAPIREAKNRSMETSIDR